uniref:ATP synthase complex subunit 8 n=1 Tax=Euproctis seitzi TaxID=1706496 RepID=A0A6C0RU43_9NEOP|nr:ATP synthase F0 subunit 8 [Euproctis seitzi]QIA46635.1 ATP synthase F0 subunit 8 [Euproctis seitzi]
MPQMMPINWIFYLIFFLMLFMLFNMMHYYMFININIKNKNLLIMKKNNLIWKW